MTKSNRFLPTSILSLCLIALTLLTACTTYVSVEQVSLRESYRHEKTTALGFDDYSGFTHLVLRRFDLEDLYRKDPEATLKSLHEKACTDQRRDLLFALCELNYLHAERKMRSPKPGASKNAPDFYLASAIYAYLYLFNQSSESDHDLFDPRSRASCDFYNRALAKGFATAAKTNSVVHLTGGDRALFQGSVQVAFDHSQFPTDLDQIDRFLPADDFIVHGLTTRNRNPGLGAPLLGVRKKADGGISYQRLPATLFLRVSGDVKQWSAGQLSLSLSLYSPYETTSTEVNGHTIPLETDTTIPMAHSLGTENLWGLGEDQFFSSVQKVKNGIYPTRPHQPGRIPVVFIHGTFSSPVWWAEMWNTLQADPVISSRFEFWNYIYNSGLSVSVTARNFRTNLASFVHELDPQQQDPALQQMVLIGHSQGGLLAKMAVTDPGDKLWKALSKKNLDEMKLNDAQRELIQECLFFKPLPFVKQVVFISTPHRGSYRINAMLLRLASWLVNLPGGALRTVDDALRDRDQFDLPRELRNAVPNSITSMSPHNKVQLTLADIPPAPDVHVHSIISVKGDGDPKEGNDGIVNYSSAHVDYAESEFIVRSVHSCQDKPATIEEVRRILLEHLGSMPKTNQ